jgi:hypothetical protein
MRFVLTEAWHEFRAGLRGSVLLLIFLVLTGYILVVMTSADNLRDLGAVEVPRNAPGLVYLMTSGDAFFLLFAWAWVFAQPVLRDRGVQLHEVVLAAPISLRGLLVARYLGALGVALVLGSSQVLGFLLAPLLEAMGAVPTGSVAAAPWLAFGWAALLFTLPLAAGSGALYFATALKTRNLGGAFAIAAALMACWMVAMIVFKEGHANPVLATLLDPSGFGEAERQVVHHWTPQQKSSALLELTSPLLWNRLLWGVLPLVVLAWTIVRARRETLVLEASPRAKPAPAGCANRAAQATRLDRSAFGPVAAVSWLRATGAEALWQLRRVAGRRPLWVALALLSLLAVAAGFVHGVQHAYGPMVARPEFISPVLLRTFYLIVVFMVAALVGLAARRDEVIGMAEMFDAAPAPDGVRLVGRAVAALVVCVLAVLVPALGAVLTSLLMVPSHGLLQPVLYMLAVLLPAIAELGAITLLLHALIRHAGTAHAASVLAAFVAVVNFEVGLINYPPYQVGRGVAISVSGLTGLAPWAEKITASAAFKLALILVILALAAMWTRRGTDERWLPRWQSVCRRLRHWPGAVALAGLAAGAASGAWLSQRYVNEGGYQTHAQEQAEDAAWEQRWLPQQTGFATLGGEVLITVRPQQRDLLGQWRLEGVKVTPAAGGVGGAPHMLHAALPNGFELQAVQVQGQPANATVDGEHLAIPLRGCPEAGCRVELHWRVPAGGWATGGHDEPAQPSWLAGQAFWLRAAEVMPRLGLDAARLLRTPADRQRLGLAASVVPPAYLATLPSTAAAPAGAWRWQVTVDGQPDASTGGELHGLLDFAAARVPTLPPSEVDGVRITHDTSRDAEARDIADDLAVMRGCVAQHLGRAPAVSAVQQWPRGLLAGGGDATLAAGTLLLAEAPHWDVAAQGTGRWVRRAAIAAAIARRMVLDTADLREGQGALWIAEGLPGALGLRCVAETDGPVALQALLARGAQRTTQSLAGAEVPVGPLATAQPTGWAPEYAPLAALSWTLGQTPEALQALLARLRHADSLETALAAHLGASTAALWLGPPRAVDLHAQGAQATGEQSVWREGGWQLEPGTPAMRAVRWVDKRLLWQAERPDASLPVFWLHDQPAYEREPRDNAGGQR